MSKSALTPRQAAFVSEYLVDLNGTQAAIRAGYAERGASVQAARLLVNASIQAAVQAGMAKRAASTDLTAEWVVRRLQSEAEREDEGSSHSARVSALGLLGKHLGMFVEKVQHQGEGGGALQVIVRSYADDETDGEGEA